jgi:hypothetical protein
MCGLVVFNGTNLHNPTDVSKNCVARHLKVPYEKIGLILSVKIVLYDTICPIM